MHIRVERDALAHAVTWAARTLPIRPSMPVLSGVMLVAEGDSLTLSSFDYEISAKVQCPVDVLTPGKTLVSGRLLADITKALPAQPVVVKVEGNRVVIECGRSSFTLPTLPVEDYPSLPDMPDTAGNVDSGVFAQAVAQVAIAAGKDDTLPVLTGIRMEIDGTNVTLAATDRYRLAVRTFPWSPKKTSMELNTLIPAKILADSAKIWQLPKLFHLLLPQTVKDSLGLNQMACAPQHVYSMVSSPSTDHYSPMNQQRERLLTPRNYSMQ